MRERNLALVERLRRAKIRFTEFQRVAADETITAALAGLMLGSKTKKLKESQFAEATRSLPYLWKLFNDIQKAVQTGRLESVSDYGEIDDLVYNALLEDPELYDMLVDELGDYPDRTYRRWSRRSNGRSNLGRCTRSYGKIFGLSNLRLCCIWCHGCLQQPKGQ